MNKKRIFLIIGGVLILFLLIFLGMRLLRKEYTVTFNIYENRQEIVKTKNHKVEEPANPVLDGYEFLGWFRDEEKFDFNVKVESDIVLYAKWEKKSVIVPGKEYVTVTFNSNGGSSIVLERIEKGTKVKRPGNPTRKGYDFVDWFNDEEKFDFNSEINSNITLYAKWKKQASINSDKKEYVTVSFNTNGGSSIASKKVEKGEPVLKPNNPTRSGYNFVGWYTSTDKLYNFNSIVTYNMILYAKWEKINTSTPKPNLTKEYVIVTFNSNGGSGVAAKRIEKGKTVSKPNNPTRSGYDFVGWYTSSDKLYNFNSAVNNNITLYAKWEKKNTTTPELSKEYVTVTFNSNGGSSVAAKRIEKGKTVSKPNNPTRSGYNFIGWYTSSDKLYNFNSVVNSDMTLYAKWEKINTSTPEPSKEYVTVTFKTNGGSSIASKKIEKGKTVSKPSNPTRSGYNFIGWYTSARSEFNFSTKINSNITLSALWAPKISYSKSNTGKWIFINNPESIASVNYLADSDLGKSSIYSDKINGNTEIFYSHIMAGNLSGQTYYAIRVFNPNKTSVTLTVNNCGNTSGWDYFEEWRQYYYNTCSFRGKYVIPANSFKYIYHNDSKFTFGDESIINTIAKPKGFFHGVLNVTTNGELAMAVIAFKDVKKTHENTYKGNFDDNVMTDVSGQKWTANSRMYSGYRNGLPVVNNNVTFEIYDETPKGNLKVSYVNPSNVTKIDSKWKTNSLGGRFGESYNVKLVDDVQLSDILELKIPLRNNTVMTVGPYPLYKETRNIMHYSGYSIKGWPYSLANWSVHYNENITIKNNSNSSKSVSFVVSDAEQLAAYYNGRIIECKNKGTYTIWTVSVPARSSKTISSVLTLATGVNASATKEVVLNN